MATLRKDGRYQAVYTDPSTGKLRTVYGRTNEEAEEKKRVQQAEGRAGPTPSIDLMLHDLAGLLWWPGVETTGRPNTIRRYRNAYENHVQPKWGRRTVDTIRTSEIQAWINEKRKDGVPAASLTLYRSILSAILKLCLDEHLIVSNPASSVKMPRIVKRRRVVSVSGVRALLEAVEGTPIALPVYLAAVLGMRRGEICGLKWSNVCIDSRRVTIAEQRLVRHGAKKGKNVVTGPVKTDSSNRSFVLPEALFAPILRLGDLDSAYVCTERKHRPWNPEHLTWQWAGMRDGLEFADWHFHDLRHGAAGVLASLPGVSLLTIAAILGHTDIDTTMLYSAAMEETATEGFSRLSEALFGRTPSSDT